MNVLHILLGNSRLAVGAQVAKKSKSRFLLIAITSIGTLILLTISSVTAAGFLFDRQVQQEIAEMFARSQGVATGGITEDDLARLPEPIQRWLRYAQVVGKPRIATARLAQRGFVRLGADQPWVPVEGEELVSTNPPSFIWSATIKQAPFMSVRVRDRYVDGQGNMLVKLFALLPLADDRGPGMDQGTLGRYLSEIGWFPTAALSDYIHWEAIDSHSARATLSYQGATASAIFYVEDVGTVTNIVTERYYSGTGTMERFEAPGISEYKEFQGFRIPVQGVDGTWKLKTGDVPYVRLEVTNAEYNLRIPHF